MSKDTLNFKDVEQTPDGEPLSLEACRTRMLELESQNTQLQLVNDRLIEDLKTALIERATYELTLREITAMNPETESSDRLPSVLAQKALKRFQR